MSHRPPSDDQLVALRDEFRRSPPSRPRDFRDVGRATGVTEATARRAYTRGWFGVPAIEVALAEERALAAQSVDVLKVEAVAAGLQSELARLGPVVAALVDGL